MIEIKKLKRKYIGLELLGRYTTYKLIKIVSMCRY